MHIHAFIKKTMALSCLLFSLDSSARPVRVMSFEGGGMRGLLSSRFLEFAEEKWNGPTRDRFDVIAGTSTGAIQACLATFPDPATGQVSSAKEMRAFYEQYGSTIFTKRHALTGPKYKTSPFRRLLVKRFGKMKLSDVPAGLELVVTAYDVERRMPKIFRSQAARQDAQEDVFIVDLLLAATAAPTYFKVVKLRSVAAHRALHAHLQARGIILPFRRYSESSFKYWAKRSDPQSRLTISEEETFHLVDGAVCANNPALIAFDEAHGIFDEPFENYTVLSLGTGYSRKNVDQERLANAGILPWIKLFSNQMIGAMGHVTQYCLETFVPKKMGDEVHSLRINLEITEGPTKIDITQRRYLDAWVGMVDKALEGGELRDDFENIIRRIQAQTDVLSYQDVEGRISGETSPTSPWGGGGEVRSHPSLDDLAAVGGMMDEDTSSTDFLMSPPPLPPVKPVRVFSIDGMGYQALTVAKMVEAMVARIEKQDQPVVEELRRQREQERGEGASHEGAESSSSLGLDQPQYFHELFDYYVGTDTGAFLMAAALKPKPEGGPQYSPADLVTFFRERGAELYAHKAGYFLRPLIGPKCQHEPLEALLDEVFGTTTLAQLLGDVMIPLYDLSGEMVLLQSAKARTNPKYDFYVKDVVRAAMAIPPYFQIPQIRNLTQNVADQKEYYFVSGSIFAPDPALLGLAEAYRLSKHRDLSRFILASFGVETHHPPFEFKKMKRAGRITWADKIMPVLMEGKLTQILAHSLTHQPMSPLPHYYRIQPYVSSSGDSVDDTSRRTRRDLLEGVRKFMNHPHNETIIGQLIYALRHNLVRSNEGFLREMAQQVPLRRQEHGLSIPGSEAIPVPVGPEVSFPRRAPGRLRIRVGSEPLSERSPAAVQPLYGPGSGRPYSPERAMSMPGDAHSESIGQVVESERALSEDRAESVPEGILRTYGPRFLPLSSIRRAATEAGGARVRSLKQVVIMLEDSSDGASGTTRQLGSDTLQDQASLAGDL